MTSSLFSELAYVALGDSLTIGHGVKPVESWPARLARNLQKESWPVSLTRNLASSGNTSQQVLQNQVPVFEKSTPDFATLLIGSNDMARGISVSTFTSYFSQILDRMQKALSDPSLLLLFNLPDFASTPAAIKYQGHLHMAPIIGEFNAVIAKEAESRKLEVADLYNITKRLGPDQKLYNWDGLHPSAQGYEELEKSIRPSVIRLLSSRLSGKLGVVG